MKAWFSAATAAFFFAVMPAYGSLYQLQIQGTVSQTSGFPSISVGQTWKMTLIYDTAIPDSFPGTNSYGSWVNALGSLAIRKFDFEIGSLAVHLVDYIPEDTTSFRIDIDNYGIVNGAPPPDTKTFWLHVPFSDPLLTLDGKPLNGFNMNLIDSQKRGYWDGTDTLPTDPALSWANFDDGEIGISDGQGAYLQGTPAGLTLVAVPGPGTGILVAISILIFGVRYHSLIVKRCFWRRRLVGL